MSDYHVESRCFQVELSFVRFVCHGVTPRFAKGRIQRTFEGYEALLPLRDCMRELLFEISIFRFLKRFDVDRF